MIHFLALVLSLPLTSAQPLSRFERYCAQLKADTHQMPLRPNSQIDNLMDVVNKTKGIDQLMRDSVVLGDDYQGFKDRMAKRQIILNDLHEVAYARAARDKCDLLAASQEANEGTVHIDAHTSPTIQQLGRHVDDSGVGVSSPEGAVTDGDRGTER